MSNTPEEKAKQVLAERKRRSLCLSANICPVDGNDLVYEWEGTGWFGRKKRISGHHEMWSEAKCPTCNHIYFMG
jgi:hypothetical protein